MTQPSQFRIPLRAIRLQYSIRLGLVALGILGGAVFSRGPISWLIAGKVFLPFIVVAVVAYRFSCRKVWVVVSPSGIQGKIFLLFPRSLEWTEVNTAFARPAFFSSGYSVGKGDEMGVPLPFQSVFVPRAIFESPEFLAAIREFAPVGHPLLSRKDRAQHAHHASNEK